MSRPLSIAISCHTPQWHDTEDALRETLRKRVMDAQCQLLVFPEYAALEAAFIGPKGPEPDPDPASWITRGPASFALWVDILCDLAQAEGCHILAGSGLCHGPDGGIVNRAVLIAPDGSTGQQDKLIPTPWERDALNLAPGQGLRLFDTSIGKIGISICYDAEFPAYSRALAAAGAEILLVPACTDTQAGQDRVQIAARARALENQCVVVHAPLIGDVPSCDVIDTNIGMAGVFGPPDWGQPEGGIHALAHAETRAWCRVVPDLDQIDRTRTRGNARIFNDWPRQNLTDLPVKTVLLGK